MKSSSIQKSKRTSPIWVITTILLISVFLFSACTPAATPAPATEAPKATEAPAATSAPAATEPPAATTAPKELITVKVGATPVPHADILKFVQDNLAEKAGIKIEIVEFNDYVQPNLAVNDGQLDANFFQHLPYLEDFNKQRGLDLVSIAAVHIEPLGIYSKKIKALSELKDGATVGIPNDATNAGRALHLLAANELIKLKVDSDYSATVNDIAENPKNLNIVELEAAQLVRALEDTDISVINGNYALQGDLSPAKDGLALESGFENPYANILVVKKGHENDEGLKILAGLLTSPEVKKFLEEKYDGSVIPAY